MSSTVTPSAPDTMAMTVTPPTLAEQTRELAARLYELVAIRYLAYRRQYYGEPDPSLETEPPATADIHRGELAGLAESMVKRLPAQVRTVPILGGLAEHLEEVSDLHSLAHEERTALTELTVTFLHGLEGGIQPWLVEWLAEAGRRLAKVEDEHYFLQYPWHGLLYQEPKAAEAFAQAVARGETAEIEREVERLATALAETLREPLKAHERLAFTGPDGESRRALFHLKTSASLGVAAYVVFMQLRTAVNPRRPTPPPRSVLPPLHPEGE